MRYNAEWLLNCLLVRIASPRAYKLLIDLIMLPLPTMSRLTQILKGIPCKYGFQVVCLETIQRQMSKQPPNTALGTLVVDEIKLRQSYEFNKSTYNVDGFVDYGGVVKEGTGQLVDRALVFMFVPMFEGWVQPIASFATKGAAPGRVLAELVLEAVVQLHKYGATVIAVVSDGVGNNKSMWQQFGAGEHRINFSHYKVLFETEKTKHLKVVPKLTEAHTQPSNLQKMNVRLATHVIKDFLNILNETERNHRQKNMILFASRQTIESLRVTLLSVLDIIEELLAAGGTLYVLTAKLNQDPLEWFFGIVRCFKGDEDHPSITQFSQIYRLLSLYTPLKTAIKGNCTGPCDSVLVSFQDSLGLKANAAAKLQCIISFPDENNTQDSSNCSVQDMVVYCLCGYVHRKMEKVTTCKDCLASLTSTPEEYAAAPKPQESALTQMRSFKQGCLRHPSRSLFLQ
ncbi:hypothetical protein HPB49_004268 [Dermacentor silvarum]|uniref:Uncharacterized protein n=1 Tax=Dermacentor silvarum TaxID=543639 RepID=A0ACB8CVB4_DERSI|nr:hypothetical protein HPB49_004268 [Dermacentor silvarum]